MFKNKDIEEAVSTYVKSLEEEQKDGKLMENKKPRREEDNLSSIERIVVFVKRIVELICLGEKVKVEMDDKSNKISVYGDDLGIAIGRNGKNMQALEYIVNLVGKRKGLLDRSIILDIKDYRKRKCEKIKKMAIRMAEKAVNKGKKITLKPMCSYERKIIHNVLSSFKNVKTRSKNEEPYRRIVIYPTKGGKA